jgi:tRNA A37 threonylcarbamoyltransferase TsaD
MRAKEINKLKRLSAEVVRMYSGFLPKIGTKAKLEELDRLIQGIEGRKAAKKKDTETTATLPRPGVISYVK